MNVYNPIEEDICPECKSRVYSEGINNGVGYVYPPFNCRCGWSDYCEFADNDDCSHCDQYEMCNAQHGIH